MRLLGKLTRLADEVDGEETDNGDHDHVPPAPVVRKLTIGECGFVEELEVALWLLLIVARVVLVHDERENEHDDGEGDGKLEHLPLKQQVKVTVSATMQHPVFHLELVDNGTEHASKD